MVGNYKRVFFKTSQNRAVLMLIISIIMILSGGQKRHENEVNSHSQPTTIIKETVENNSKYDNHTSNVAEEQIQLTTEEKIEDFETLYKIIKENYPFLEVNKRVNGIDWLENKDLYIEKIVQTPNDTEFYKQLSSILRDLSNEHTHMLHKNNVLNYGIFYKSYKDTGSWREILYDELCKPEVLKRYKLKIENYEEGNETYYDGNYSRTNLSVDDIIKGKVARITIPSLIPYSMISEDEKKVKEYLEKVKDYQALIIDIRGNGGGDSQYFTDFLYPLIVPKTMYVESYLFYKNGSYVEKAIEYSKKMGSTYDLVKDMDLRKLPTLPPEVKKDFTYATKSIINIEPAKEGIKFKGNIYLLVDRAVYSSAEMMAIFSKDSGFATLIGEKTGGDGLGSDPMLAALPNSGYVFRFSIDYGTSMDGSCNEEVKTLPHYVVDNPQIMADPLQDKCIQKVLELEELN